MVLGVGGGKVLDTAKAAAHFARKPVIIAPTIASTDAPCSRVAVLYTEQGAFSHYLSLSSNPNMVVVDTLAVAQAPVRFLMAGVGDALATCYEAEAAARSGAVTMAGGCSTGLPWLWRSCVGTRCCSMDGRPRRTRNEAQ